MTDGGRHELGDFELISRLGQGGMGAVYKARQKSLDRLVALKVLPRGLAQDAEYTERFLREARAAGRLSHPNIVAGISAGFADGYHYFAMEYVDGYNLGDRLLQSGPFSEREAAGIGAQIAEGLEHAHRAGLVHRDVKPENIMVTAEGQAKLCDLGLARGGPEDLRITQAGVAVGTPYYISPEQIRGEESDGRADIYSLGCTLYHLVAGRPPFDADNSMAIMQKHLLEQARPLTEVRADVSPAFQDVVARMMAANRDERYQGASEAAAELRRVAEGPGPEVAPRTHARGRSGATTVAARTLRPPQTAPAPEPAGEDDGGMDTVSTQPLPPVTRRRGWKFPLVVAGLAITVLTLSFAMFVLGSSGRDKAGGKPPPPPPVDPVKPPPTDPIKPPPADPIKPPAATGLVPGRRYEAVFRQGAPVPELGIAAYAGVKDTVLARRLSDKEPEPGKGGSPFLFVGCSVRGDQVLDGRSVLSFDLSAIPRAARIERAALELTGQFAGPEGICVALYRLTSPWEPSEKDWHWDTGASWSFASGSGKTRVPWKVPGGDFDSTTDWGQGPNGQLCAPLTSGFAMKKTVSFDITRLAQAWVAGTQPNYGVLVKPEPPSGKNTNWYIRASKLPPDRGPIEDRPTLRVAFVAP